MKLPDLGDSSKKYSIELTEPEIMAMCFMIAHMKEFTVLAVVYKHYHSTILGLEEKIKICDEKEPV